MNGYQRLVMKLYVITRKDLSPLQRAVQAGHAIAELVLHSLHGNWDNGTIVLLGVKNEFQLKKWIDKLSIKDVKYAIFKEPDIGNQITALATVCDNKVFKKLNLL